jgi:hypothetical protein
MLATFGHFSSPSNLLRDFEIEVQAFFPDFKTARVGELPLAWQEERA